MKNKECGMFVYDMPEKLRNDLLRLETDCRRFGYRNMRIHIDDGVLTTYVSDRIGIHLLVHFGRKFFEKREVR